MLVLIAVIAVIGAFLFGVPQKLLKYGINTQQKQANQTEQLSIAGKVSGVTLAGNSFKLINIRDGKEVIVKLGSNTKMVRLVFPFDVKNPPESKTFTPKLQPATLKDLKAGDQVFIRASEAIKAGQDVINPIEIQILP